MAADRRFEEAAIEYTRAGRAVFPVNGKAPYTARGFKDATMDEDQIRRWWSTWPDAGIATPIRAGEFVLDIDDLASVDELPRELPTSAEAKTGSGGRHVWFGTSERVTNSPGNLPGGIHVRGQGGYVVLPPSRHPSGAAYEWIRAPQEHPFAQAPVWLLRLIKPPSSNGTTPPTEGDIPEETRNIALTSMAGAMRRKGFDVAAMLAALKVTNETRCKPPLGEREVEQIARSVARYEPADVPWRLNSHAEPADVGATPKFSARPLERERMRSPKWVFEGYILAGSLNGLVGPGGAGKGTFMAWLIAKLTRGELPGALRGRPATVLVIGDEDAPDEVWTPRIVAAGGDEQYVHVLEYDSGTPLSLVRDIGRLEEIVRDLGAAFIYLDQVLDHFLADSNSHVAADVRQTLGPVRGLARRLEIAAEYTTHPNKLSGARSARDRTGGSGQFVDLPRSMLALGWHPDREGWRAVARGKGNVGRVPPAIAFTIETGFARNPQTGEVIEVGMVGELEEDHELRAENILPHPPRDREESKVDLFERVMHELGRDGDRHSRDEARAACAVAGIDSSYFSNLFARCEFIERDRKGRETWWSLSES